MPEFCNEDECDSIDEPTKAKNLARYLGMKDGVSASISSEVTRWASCIIEFVLNKRNTIEIYYLPYFVFRICIGERARFKSY